jgi:hypothetical protein
MNVSWDLAPEEYIKPEYITLAEQAIVACPSHLWELVLEDNGEVSMGCELCPACVDDLYPDGQDLIFYAANGIEIEMGFHNLPDEATPVRIPVTASVVSSRNYWGEYDAEMFIESRPG